MRNVSVAGGRTCGTFTSGPGVRKLRGQRASGRGDGCCLRGVRARRLFARRAGHAGDSACARHSARECRIGRFVGGERRERREGRGAQRVQRLSLRVRDGLPHGGLDRVDFDDVQAKVALHGLLDAHHVMKGQPTSHPVVTALNTSASPATVLLADCVDMAHWIEVQKATGKPVSAGPGGHEAVSVVVVEYPGDGWLVQQSRQSKVPSC